MICMLCFFKFSKTAHIFGHTNDNVVECKLVEYIYIYIYIYIWYDMYVLHLQVQ